MHLHSCPNSSSFCDQSVVPLAEGERCLNWIKCVAIVLRALWLVFFFTFDSSCFTHILHVSSKLVYTNWLSLVPAFIGCLLLSDKVENQESNILGASGYNTSLIVRLDIYPICQ